MTQLRFGTAGIPYSTRSPNTINGIRRVAELGLGAMEIEFVEGVYMKEPEALEVARVASELGISLSVHAPYFLNFSSSDNKKARQSQGILHKAARIAHLCGARSIVFHAGFYMGKTPEEAYEKVKAGMIELLPKLADEGITTRLRPEVAGKMTQFGSLEEVLQLCSELPALAPTIDFAHLHSRGGAYNTYDEFASVLSAVSEKLGSAALADLHLHVSGIAYTTRGEVRHLDVEESNLRYRDLLRALHQKKAGGTVICESPSIEDDTLKLQSVYRAL